MSDKKETTQLNARIDQQRAEEFRALCEEQGITQAHGIEAAIDAWKVSDFADKMPGRREEIDRFMRAVATITDGYQLSLAMCCEADDRIRKEFKNKIESYEKQIAQQSNEIERLNLEAQEADEHIARLENDVKRETARAEFAISRADDLSDQLEQAVSIKDMLNELQVLIIKDSDDNNSGRNSEF